MADYWHRLIECPFYLRSEKREVYCEGGRLKFKSKLAIGEFLDNCEHGWQDCPIAKTLLHEYEREDKHEKNKRLRGKV